MCNFHEICVIRAHYPRTTGREPSDWRRRRQGQNEAVAGESRTRMKKLYRAHWSSAERRVVGSSVSSWKGKYILRRPERNKPHCEEMYGRTRAARDDGETDTDATTTRSRRKARHFWNFIVTC